MLKGLNKPGLFYFVTVFVFISQKSLNNLRSTIQDLLRAKEFLLFQMLNNNTFFFSLLWADSTIEIDSFFENPIKRAYFLKCFPRFYLKNLFFSCQKFPFAIVYIRDILQFVQRLLEWLILGYSLLMGLLIICFGIVNNELNIKYYLLFRIIQYFLTIL